MYLCLSVLKYCLKSSTIILSKHKRIVYPEKIKFFHAHMLYYQTKLWKTVGYKPNSLVQNI